MPMKLLRYCFPTLFHLYEWGYEHFTPGGWVLFALLCFSGPSLMQSDTPLIHVLAVSSALFIMAIVIGAFFRPHLKCVTRVLPRMQVGEITQIEVQIENLSRWGAYDLHLSFAASNIWQFCSLPESIPLLAAGATCVCRFSIQPHVRGVHSLPALRVCTSFPFHILLRFKNYEFVSQVSVYPASWQGKTTDCDLLLQGETGAELEQALLQRGEEEYVGNTEYRPGLPVRRWDYASWARLARPIVREYVENAPACCHLWVDSYFNLPATETTTPEFEQALSLTVRLLEILQTKDWRVSQFHIGTASVTDSNHAEGIAHETMLDALATAQCVATLEMPQWTLEASHTETPLLLVFSIWNKARAQLCETLIKQNRVWHGFLIADKEFEVQIPQQVTVLHNA
jgi:uncharacterized protein (DUF58 family)